MPSKSSKTKTRKSAGTDPGASFVRVAAYCRYSEGRDQDDSSIEAQHLAIEREAAQHGNWRITYYDEPGRSAFHESLTKRPRLQDVMRDALDGQYDMVCVHKVDRWSRRANVTLETWDQLARAGVQFHTIVGRVDMMTAPGWLMANLQAALPEFYSRNLAEEVRKGQEIRAQSGLHCSRPPFGYRRSPGGVPEPDRRDDGTGEWDGLQHLYELLLTGKTNQEASDAMNADGRWHMSAPGGGKRMGQARPFTHTSISNIRNNVFYRPYREGDTNGTITWDDEEYRGQHIAACTWDAWQTMRQAAIGRRRGWQAGKAHSLRAEPYTAEFRGLASCAGCGGRLYVHRSVDQRKDGIVYGISERYSCDARNRATTCIHGGQWARVEEVRGDWVDWLEAHATFSPEWQRQIRETVLAAKRGEIEAGAQPDELRAARERQRWQRKRDAARHLYLEGEIDRTEWERRAREADEALARLAAAARKPEQQMARLVEAGNMLLSVAKWWAVWNTQERQQAAALLVEPLGLVMRPLGYRGLYSWATPEDERPPTCELVDVRLREPFRELLAMLSDSATETA